MDEEMKRILPKTSEALELLREAIKRLRESREEMDQAISSFPIREDK